MEYLGKCGQERFHGSIITKGFAAVGEAVHLTGPEDETTTQLERIPPEFVLRMAGGFGARAGLGIVASQQVKQVRALEFHGGISFALFVNEQRKGDAGFVAKSSSIDAVPETHSCQVGSAVSEGLFVRAQLRDMLAAENSTIMAQENHYGGLADPQGTKTDLFAVQIRQGNNRKSATESRVHVSILNRRGSLSTLGVLCKGQ